MSTFPIYIQILILLALSLLHYYWAIGGQWGFAEALPVDEAGKRMLNPGKIDSSIVATGLLAFAAYYAHQAGFLSVELPPYVSYVGWAIPAIFLLRSVGDFRYVGFFKRVRETAFAKNDTFFYSPLCLTLATIGFYLQVFV